MEQKARSVEPYQLINDENGYLFITDNNVHYELSFVKDNPTGDETPYSENLYAFAFAPVNRKKNPYDEKVMITIIEGIIRFLSDNQKVLYFVYDISDGKGDVRNRKFKKHITDFKSDNIKLLQSEIKTNDSKSTFYITMLFKSGNEYSQDIINDFNSNMFLLNNK